MHRPEEQRTTETSIHTGDAATLLLHAVRQSLLDWVKYHPSLTKKTRGSSYAIWESAEEFLHNPAMTIRWGGEEYSLQDICDVCEIDICALHRRLQERLAVKVARLNTSVTPPLNKS